MLNDEQITFYRQNGYVAVEDVLSEDEVDDLRRVTDEFIERSRLLIKGGEIFDLGPDHTGDRPQVRRINAPWKHHSVYDRTLRHEGILDIVDQLIGPGLRLRGAKLNMKSEDRVSQVEWHQDWAFFPHTNDDLLTVGVAIDDMDVTNGCLQVIPGSHQDRLYDHHQDGYFVGAVAEPDFDDSTAVPVEVKAGGLSIHHVRTLHGSLPSVSGRPRRLLLFTHGALDAWPLMGGGWDSFGETVLRGDLTNEIRIEKVPARISLPRHNRTGTIYGVQSRLERTTFGKSQQERGS